MTAYERGYRDGVMTAYERGYRDGVCDRGDFSRDEDTQEKREDYRAGWEAGRARLHESPRGRRKERTMDAVEVAAAGGSVADILEAMDPDYRREWPQAAYDWALRLRAEYGPPVE